MIALAAHYSQPPEWRWYILAYFFLAGLAGGAYTLGTILRVWGAPRDQSAARLCFLLALPATLLCPVFLTIDLGQPARFWHMMVDTGVASSGLNFKYWSPMSLGVWGLLVFGVFAALSFLEAVAQDGRYRYPGSRMVAALGSGVGRAINLVGTLPALFVAAYTGILLSVSNQPVWSDSYALGGLFVASGMSGAVALVTLFTPWRPTASASHQGLAEAEGNFALLELAFVLVLFVTLAFAGQLSRTLAAPWFVLWAVAILSLLVPLAGRFAGRPTVSGAGALAMVRTGVISTTAGALITLLGVLALRAAVLWSAQA